jgi:hypothetical protein
VSLSATVADALEPSPMPSSSRLPLAFAAASLLACGGRVASETSEPVEQTGTNMPAPLRASCTRACTRIQTCTGQEDLWCTDDCARQYDGRGATTYAACIDGLSCQTIERGLFMDFGPLGECHAKAQAAMRGP